MKYGWNFEPHQEFSIKSVWKVVWLLNFGDKNEIRKA